MGLKGLNRLNTSNIQFDYTVNAEVGRNCGQHNTVLVKYCESESDAYTCSHVLLNHDGQ